MSRGPRPRSTYWQIMYYFLFSPRLLRHLKRLAPCFVRALTRPNDERLSGPAGRHPRRGLPSSPPPPLSLSAPIFTFFHSFSPGRAGRCRPRKSGKESTRLIKLVGMASSMSSGAGTSALRFWASRFLRRQESHVGALSALGARGYKTTTGIVGVEVDPEAPETLRHLLKKILRVSLEEVRTARRGRGWGGAREGGRPFQPFPSARDASSRAWPRGCRRESGKKNLE